MFQITQALSSVLGNGQQIADMRRSWSEIDFESVRNQCALVCNCRHDDLVQLLEVDFVAVLDNLVAGASLEPVRDIMNWADLCCERLMSGGEKSMSSRSVLIRWGYVTSQIMRDLVSCWSLGCQTLGLTQPTVDHTERPGLWRLPDHETIH